MAQNDVQKYANVTDLYNDLRQPLTTYDGLIDRFERMANFLNSADATTYPTIPTETLSDLGALRTGVNAFLSAQSTIDFHAIAKTFVKI